MQTQMRMCAIGFALVCLAVTLPAADGQQAAAKDKTYHFQFTETPWSEVLDWLVEITGLPMLGQERVPVGKVTFRPEVGPGGRLKQYTVPEIIESLNEIMEISRGQKWIIVRRQASIGLYPADEPLPIGPVKIATWNDVINRQGIRRIASLRTAVFAAVRGATRHQAAQCCRNVLFRHVRGNGYRVDPSKQAG